MNDTTHTATIVNRLKKFREQRGYMTYDLSVIIKLPESTYRAYESGHRTTPLQVLQQLSRLYKVSIDDLYTTVMVERDDA